MSKLLTQKEKLLFQGRRPHFAIKLGTLKLVAIRN